ncbi:hypothetical protein DSL72_001353 [Monilinia vaccinii-corymbosi]|uniref:Uncharacterized protein n=1 Tax=Monilinia vaccinii-corymbosi TaxID=61207 RepID=A0A8A3P5U4_9HELO|nr:hypothetical protein DSL72_001353 [Monilinia vaccinii-corymbosi]
MILLTQQRTTTIRARTPHAPPTLHIPPRRATAAHGHVDEPGEDRARGADPHKRKHLMANRGADIQAGLRRDDVAEDDEHDGGDDGGRRGQQGGDEGPDGVGARDPARVDGAEGEEDVDEVHDGPGDEEAEHDPAGDADQAEDLVDLGGERDGGAGEELVEQDLDGVEPVESRGLGAEGDAVGVVAFAEVPEADLVEVVEAEGAGERVGERDGGPDGCGDDVGEVETEEPGFSEDGAVVRIADDGLEGGMLVISSRRERDGSEG